MIPPVDRAAILAVTTEVLEHVLQLPAGSYIDAVTAPHDQPGILHLRLRGAGWPVRVGDRVPHAFGILMGHPICIVIDWRLPTAEVPELAGNARPTGAYTMMSRTDLIEISFRLSNRAVIADIEGECTPVVDAAGTTWWDTRPMLDEREHCTEVVDMMREALDYALVSGIAEQSSTAPHLLRLVGRT